MDQQRTRNLRGHGDRLRAELLEAAVALLAEHRSSQAVTLRQVAARARVSPTAVYRHFAGRDELVAAAVRWCWERFDAALDVADTGDPAADFLAQGRAYLGFAATEPGIYRVLFGHRDALAGPMQEAGGPVFAKLVGRVAALLALQGDDRDPWAVAVQVHTWIHGIADLQGPHGVGPAPTDWLLGELALRLGLIPAPAASGTVTGDG